MKTITMVFEDKLKRVRLYTARVGPIRPDGTNAREICIPIRSAHPVRLIRAYLDADEPVDVKLATTIPAEVTLVFGPGTLQVQSHEPKATDEQLACLASKLYACCGGAGLENPQTWQVISRMLTREITGSYAEGLLNCGQRQIARSVEYEFNKAPLAERWLRVVQTMRTWCTNAHP